ncbi:MAG: glycosyltransferase family 4 protein [Methanobacterium sp.]|jgi:glycosyltransferase involved in cell wall biosynthesis|uniref:glycosyltransferase family 4 protein n=1 Tax=Methanobacterium sp. TaxID=2164 RepID=UPI0025895C1F|nr:glycosyltransferase family 4 protein [Methanobacterium sp.]MCC7560303.1 glycosyltransferase family 4 protein [Methanobacterium sp.]
MRIGYFIGHFPYPHRLQDDIYIKKYAHGGVEMAAYHLARHMVEKSEDVDIFTTAIGKNDEEQSNGLKIHRYATSFKVASANVSFKLWREPLNYELDLVHAHSPIPYSDLPALRYAKRYKVPFVVSYHFDGQETGGSFLRNSGVILYNRLFLSKVLDQAEVILVGTRTYANESPHLKEFHDKIRVVPYGINLKEFQISCSPKEARQKLNLPLEGDLILFFGSLVPYKGPEVLIKALKLLEHKSAHVVFAGRGPMEMDLRQLSQELGVENQVIFDGFVPEELKKYYYRAADIFCLPSVTMAESFGIVNLEAMASSLPVVASRLGGLPEVVRNGENGLLVEPKVVGDLASKLSLLLENPTLRHKLGKNGRKIAENYNWDRVVDLIHKIYEEVL